ncbi:MAG: ABC transporter permease [Fusobacteriaceae bacterium]|jgi:lipoprotein-releasing system permease protein|nr:ABC transporter permease [Fusobacteriaceae bacterium]
MTELFIAKKHITERKRQSLISIFGVALGVIVLTVSIGIANGLNKNLIDNILSITSHIFISNYGRIENYNELKEKIEQIPGVKGVVPTIETQGIVKHNGPYGVYVAGTRIEGYQLKSVFKAMELDKKIIEGEIKTDQIDGILIGKELYKIIGGQIGDEIIIISSENREISFKLTGVFQSGYYDYDVNMVVLPLEATQYLMQSGDVVNKINIMLNNPYKANEIRDKIVEVTEMEAKTWGELNKNLLAALSLEKTVMILVFSLIVIIAGFVVWVTLNMLVREKIKDIGIMRAMGFSKGSIMKIFLFQGIILGLIGIIIGLLVSFCILWYLKNNTLEFVSSIYYLTKIPIEISTMEVIYISAANIVVIFMSSIFPAYRASKMDTVEALRYE